MRIDVKKILFIGMDEDRERFFKLAQDLGVIQFIDFQGLRKREMPEFLQKISSAIKVLRGLPTTEQEEMEDFSHAEHIADEILDLKDQLTKLEESLRVTNLEIARIQIFGDFSLDDIHKIEKEGHRKIQFFCGKEGIAEKKLSDQLIYIGTDQRLDYFVSISKETENYDQLIEMHIEEPLSVLHRRIRDETEAIHIIEQKLKTYVKYNTFLHHALIERLNVYNLKESEQFPKKEIDGALFAVEGWVPVDKMDEMRTLTENVKVHSEEIAITEKDEIPTHLENTGLSRLGEDLVHIYDTPSHTDRDPSLWLLVFFSMFFAMIIGDAGYGLVYLLAALYMYYKAPKVTTGGKRLIKLVVILCGACLIWGVMINSYFGIKISPESPLRKVSALQWLVNEKANYHLSRKDQVYNEWLVKYPQLQEVNSYTKFLNEGKSVKNGSHEYDILNAFSDNILMEFALFIGCLHVCLSLLRYLDRHWAAIGWVIAIIGAYLYIPEYLNATSFAQYLLGIGKEEAAQQGKYLFIGGFSLALILGFVQYRLSGILEITLIIQIFSDILSYLRLYALGLASAIISVTVNEIAASLGIVFGTLLVVFGHMINMGLAVIGGVIHGLRLNFLEWYHYSFEGGGRQFSPLAKIEIE